MSSNSIRAGVIGAGMVPVRAHIPAYQRLPNVEVVAICDIKRERAESVAAQAGIPHVYADYKRMLSQENLDVVSICTPNAFHAEMSIAALDAGVNVLCEKPMALTYADAQAMIAAARKARKQLTIAFTNRPRPEMQMLRRYSESGKFGEIYYTKANYWRRSGIPGYGSWFTNRDLAGGGAMMDIGVHYLDLALWIMGHPKPVAVTAASYAKFGPRGIGLGGWGRDILPPPQRCDVDDLVTTNVRFENGASLILEASWAAYMKASERLQVLGTEMGADFYPVMYGTDHPLRLYGDLDGQPAETIPDLARRPGVGGHAAIIEQWLAHLDDEEAPIPAWQGAATIQIIEAAYKSAESGQSVLL